MNEAVDKVVAEVAKEGTGGVANLMYVTKEGAGNKLVTNLGTACHADVASSRFLSAKVVGNRISHDSRTEEAKSLFEFLYGLQSPYAPFIQYMGEDFIKVYDKDGYPRGFAIKNPADKNFKLLFNFMKSLRSFTEHKDILQFWEKWYMRNKAPGGLVYLMSYFYRVGGEHKIVGHAPIENYVSPRFDLEKFTNPEHTRWNLEDLHYSKTNNYSSSRENEYVWGGGKFNPHKIKRANAHPEGSKTHFYKKYFVEPKSKATDDDLALFFREATELKGAYV